MSENFLDDSGAKPISWWMCEEATSPLLDGSANGNSLAWTDGVTRSSDKRQGIYSVQVTTDWQTGGPRRLDSALSANFPFHAATVEFTIGGWCKIPASADILLAQHRFGPEGWLFGIGPSNFATGKIGFALQGGEASLSSNSSGFTTEQWVHIIARWNGENRAGAGANDEVSLWINGVKQTATATTTSVTLVEDAGTGFGFSGSGSQPAFYDEWFVFDVALLDTQIADIFNYGLQGTPGGRIELVNQVT